MFVLKLGCPSRVLTPLLGDAQISQYNDTHHFLSAYLVPGTVLGATPTLLIIPTILPTKYETHLPGSHQGGVHLPLTRARR